MATELTVVDLPGAYEDDILLTPVDIGLEAADLAGNTFRSTGREIVFVQNDDIAQQTVTITSQPASRSGRVGDITDAIIPIGEPRIFQVFPKDGFEAGGLITVTASDADVMIAVLRLPVQAAG